jgi:hypothetical protein
MLGAGQPRNPVSILGRGMRFNFYFQNILTSSEALLAIYSTVQ